MDLEAAILAEKTLVIVTERGAENNNNVEEVKVQEVDEVMEDVSSTLHKKKHYPGCP